VFFSSLRRPCACHRRTTRVYPPAVFEIISPGNDLYCCMDSASTKTRCSSRSSRCHFTSPVISFPLTLTVLSFQYIYIYMKRLWIMARPRLVMSPWIAPVCQWVFVCAVCCTRWLLLYIVLYLCLPPPSDWYK